MSQSATASLISDDDKNAIYKRITLRLIPFIDRKSTRLNSSHVF